jgi:hypothetical protein
MVHLSSHLPLELDPCDPNFRQEYRFWALETRRQVHELVLRTTKMIESSKALMALVDRLLARPL